MSQKNDIYNKILREYDALQALNAARQKHKYAEVCEKLPRIGQIDKEIEALGISSAKESILNPKNTAEICAALEEKTAVLIKEKKALLANAGYPENYLEPEYSCPLCKDTGYIGSQKCSCFKNKLLKESYTNSSLGSVLERENFDTFDLNYYSDEYSAEYGISPQKHMEKVLKTVCGFCRDPEKGNLLFYGGPGLGKTFLCSCIAKYLMDKGKSVIYTTSWQLFQKISDAVFRCEDNEDAYKDIMDDILGCYLLIIDDLGTELTNSFTASEFFNIINRRLNNQKPVVLSTNLSIEEITEKYSERVASRILGSYKSLMFFGEDIRIQKNYG